MNLYEKLERAFGAAKRKRMERYTAATSVPVQRSEQSVADEMQSMFDPEKMRIYIVETRKERIAAAENDPNLFCYGCAHSAAGQPFPGRPSGERPCCFCVRNPDRLEWLREALESQSMSSISQLPEASAFRGVWYDGSPAIHNPMDCYQTLDMKDQLRVWQGGDPDTEISFG